MNSSYEPINTFSINLPLGRFNELGSPPATEINFLLKSIGRLYSCPNS